MASRRLTMNGSRQSFMVSSCAADHATQVSTSITFSNLRKLHHNKATISLSFNLTFAISQFEILESFIYVVVIILRWPFKNAGMLHACTLEERIDFPHGRQ